MLAYECCLGRRAQPRANRPSRDEAIEELAHHEPTYYAPKKGEPEPRDAIRTSRRTSFRSGSVEPRPGREATTRVDLLTKSDAERRRQLEPARDHDAGAERDRLATRMLEPTRCSTRASDRGRCGSRRTVRPSRPIPVVSGACQRRPSSERPSTSTHDTRAEGTLHRGRRPALTARCSRSSVVYDVDGRSLDGATLAGAAHDWHGPRCRTVRRLRIDLGLNARVRASRRLEHARGESISLGARIVIASRFELNAGARHRTS